MRSTCFTPATRVLGFLMAMCLSSLAQAVEPPTGVRGTETSPSTILWEWDNAPGANHYEVTVDGMNQGIIGENRFTSRNMWSGDHSLTVRSISPDWQYSNPSLTAKIQLGGNYDSGNPARSFVVGGNDIVGTRLQSDVIEFSDPPSNDNGPIDPVSWTMQEVYQRDGYELVFSDEFNGNGLNPARWNGQLRWDGEFNGERYEYRVINNEDQFYVNPLSEDQEHLDTIASQYNPFEFDGNRLAIRAIRNPLQTNNENRGYGALRDISIQQPFMSGAISTYDKFSQKYGYFEARIRIPSHVGTFPAFWLYHQRRRDENTRRTEIDIMENLGHAPHYIYNSFHYFENVSPTYGGDAHFVKPQPEGQIFTGIDYSQDFHTYAVEWQPGYVAWFIDGQKVSELWNSNVDHEELYLILNLAIGGAWTNFPANSGGLGRNFDQWFPNFDDLQNWQNPALEIDYVRVYRRR